MKYIHVGCFIHLVSQQRNDKKELFLIELKKKVMAYLKIKGLDNCNFQRMTLFTLLFLRKRRKKKKKNVTLVIQLVSFD